MPSVAPCNPPEKRRPPGAQYSLSTIARLPCGEHCVQNIQQEKSYGDPLVDGIVFPSLFQRKNVARIRQQLDPRREPDHERACDGQPKISAQRVPRRPLSRQFPKCRILFRSERRVFVVLFEDCSRSFFFLRCVEGPLRQVVQVDLFSVQLPWNEIAILDAKEPRLLPRHETVRDEFAGQIRISRRQKLDFMERNGIPHGPRRQRQETAHGGERHQPQTKKKSPLPQPDKCNHHPGRNEQKRCLGTKKRSHSHQQTACGRENGFPVPGGPPNSEQRRLTAISHPNQRDQSRERHSGEESGKHFRQRDGRVVRRKWA